MPWTWHELDYPLPIIGGIFAHRGICDFRIVCGPYEERRFGKKDGRDERLDSLTEIRGMA